MAALMFRDGPTLCCRWTEFDYWGPVVLQLARANADDKHSFSQLYQAYSDGFDSFLSIFFRHKMILFHQVSRLANYVPTPSSKAVVPIYGNARIATILRSPNNGALYTDPVLGLSDGKGG